MSQANPNGQPAAQPAPTPSARRLDIQGLRALAVTAVVAFHANLFIPGGFIGVDIFFVISGFVITGMLLRELERNKRISLVDFYVRRIRRLTPALIVVLIATIIASLIIFSPIESQKNVFMTAVGALLISSNFVIAANTGGYFDLPAKTNPLLHTWSLSVEEQFYVVYPLLFVILFVWLARVLKKRTLQITVLALITAVSFALPLLPTSSNDFLAQLTSGYYSPLPRVWQLGAGALLAFVAAPKPGSKLATPLAANLFGFAGLAITALGFWGLNENITYPGWATIVSVAAALALLYAGLLPGSLVNRALATKLPVFLGNISYSWYLWHWPVLVSFGLLYPNLSNWAWALGIASILPAWLSYRFVESRYQHRRETHPIRTFAVAALAISLMLGGIYALNTQSKQGYQNDYIKDLQASVKPTYAGRNAGCHATLSPDKLGAKCFFNKTATGTPLYLIGDSNADQFSDGVLSAAKTLKSPMHDATASGCPVIRGIYINSKDGNPRNAQKDSWVKTCARFANGTIDWLKTQPAGIVILASTDGYYFKRDTAIKVDNHYLSGSYPNVLDLLHAALALTVKDIQAAGHKVLLVQTIPQFDTKPYVYTPTNCSSATILAGKCKLVMPRSFVDKVQGPSRKVVATVAKETAATIFDIRDLLCSPSKCETLTKAGMYLYRDQTHISVSYSKTLGPTFAEAITALEAQPKN